VKADGTYEIRGSIPLPTSFRLQLDGIWLSPAATVDFGEESSAGRARSRHWRTRHASQIEIVDARAIRSGPEIVLQRPKGPCSELWPDRLSTDSAGIVHVLPWKQARIE